jgi:hypothetical protein
VPCHGKGLAASAHCCPALPGTPLSVPLTKATPGPSVVAAGAAAVVVGRTVYGTAYVTARDNSQQPGIITSQHVALVTLSCSAVAWKSALTVLHSRAWTDDHFGHGKCIISSAQISAGHVALTTGCHMLTCLSSLHSANFVQPSSSVASWRGHPSRSAAGDHGTQCWMPLVEWRGRW